MTKQKPTKNSVFRLMKKNIPMVLLFGAIFSNIAFAGIQTSKHDFSAESWSGGEICLPCHTPHNGDSSFDYGPLWNHELSTVTSYTLYYSPTLDATMDQPGGVSKLCLSCHDGTIAMDAFGGNPGDPGNKMTGPPAVGRNNDLSDDHPVGFRWEHQSIVSDCTDLCHFANGSNDPYTFPVRFYNHRMECSTCHDPHNNQPDNTRMLRLTIEGSQLCLLCHQR